MSASMRAVERDRSSERPMSEDDPNRNADWDWIDDKLYTLYMKNGTTFPGERLPYYEDESPVRQCMTYVHVKPEDGWVLISRDFGTSKEGSEIPRYFLYNVYTGVLRCFFFNSLQESHFNCAIVRLRLNNLSAREVPSLLTYYSGNLSQYSESNYGYLNSNNREDYLDLFDPAREAVAVTKLVHEQWFYADFYLVGFDPAIGDPKYQDAEFNFEIIGIIETDLHFNGTQSMAPLYDKGSSNIYSDVSTLLGMIPPGSGKRVFGFIKDFVSKDKANEADSDRAAEETAISSRLLDFASMGLDEYLPAIGSVMGFIGSFIGGTSAPRLIEYQGTMTIDGKATQEVTLATICLPIPGVKRSEDNSTLLWDGKMGIFNLSTCPTFLEWSYFECDIPDPWNEGSTLPKTRHHFYAKPLQLVVNDTIPGILKCEAALVVLGPLGGNTLTPYVPVENIPSFETEFTESKYADASGFRRVGIAVRVTITPHSAPPTFVPVHIYKVFVPAFRRADDTSLFPAVPFMTACGEKLFIIDGNVMRRVNPNTGEVESQGPANDWPQPLYMTAAQDRIFVIDAGQGGRLWRVAPTTLVNDGCGPENDWPQPRCMTASGDKLFVIDAGQGGRLWRVDSTTLVNDGCGPENDWPQPRCMTASGGKLFVIDAGQGGRLWRVDPTTLVNDGCGPENDWPQPRCMTATGGKLFIIDAGQGGRLWRVDPTTLVSDGCGPENNWPQPLCMTAFGGKLFVIDHGPRRRLWRVDVNTLRAEPVT